LAISNQQDSTMKKSLLIAAASALVLLSVVQLQLVAKEEPAVQPPPEAAAAKKKGLDAEQAKKLAAAPDPDPNITEPEYEKQGGGQNLSPQQKMVASAVRAFEASQAAYEAETITMDQVYYWSLRWMNAAEDVAKNRADRAAAVQAHLE